MILMLYLNILIFWFDLRWNFKKKIRKVLTLMVMASKIMRKHIFHRVSDQLLNHLKTHEVKKTSFANMKWGVKADQD